MFKKLYFIDKCQESSKYRNNYFYLQNIYIDFNFCGIFNSVKVMLIIIS